jgi:hypothetical protein
MPELTVYTCITGLYDEIKLPGGEGFMAYVDDPGAPSSFLKQAKLLFDDSTRNARMHKILSHQFVETEWSLWMDGSASLRTTPEVVFEKYRHLGDIVMFNSVEYHSVYTEAEKIIEYGYDDPQVVYRQADKYQAEGFPGDQLTTTGCILRRHTPKVIEFNNFWWSELCAHSRRDQMSVDYAFWKLGIKPAYFEGNIWDSPDFHIHPHRQPKR